MMEGKYCGSCIEFVIDLSTDCGYCKFLKEEVNEADDACRYYEEEA